MSRKVVDLPRDHPEAFDLDRLPTTPGRLMQVMKRPGRGRPPAEDPTVAVTARLTRSTVEALDALLRKRGIETPDLTRQDLLRESVGRFLAAERRKAKKAGARDHVVVREET